MTAKEKKDNKEFFEALKLMEQERGICKRMLQSRRTPAGKRRIDHTWQECCQEDGGAFLVSGCQPSE